MTSFCKRPFSEVAFSGLGLLLATGVGTPSIADPLPDHVFPEVQVEFQIRDFNQVHPDFEAGYPVHPSLHNGATPGMVLSTLDPDGNPVANPDHVANGYAGGVGRQMANADDFSDWFCDVPGTNLLIRKSITLEWDEDLSLYIYEKNHSNSSGYFPIDGQGFGETMAAMGYDHNYHFTTEIELPFIYTDPATRPGIPMIFEFTGDDDLWVFLNGELILDIGGVHPQVTDSVNIDDIASAHGLVPGEINVLKVFHAERQTAHSNFKIQTSVLLVPTDLLPLFD